MGKRYIGRKQIKDKSGNIVTKQLSPKTIKNYYSTLSGMMKYAVRMDIIELSPCHDIDLPKQRKKESRYYNKDEVIRFLDALNKVPEADEITTAIR